MRRTTIMVPDALDARLRYEAKRRGMSIADLAREALAAYLPAPPPRRRLGFFDLGAAAEDDLSIRVDAVVAEVLADRHDAGQDLWDDADR